MKRKIITGMTQTLEFEDPATMLMALQACAAGRLSYPSSSDMKWVDATFPATSMELHNPDDIQIWYPYAVTTVGMCIKPHFSATYRYVTRGTYRPAQVEMLDPTDWRTNVDNLLSDCTISDPVVRDVVERFRSEYLDPPENSAAFHMRAAMDERVRQSIQEGVMVFDTKKARQMMRYVLPGR